VDDRAVRDFERVSEINRQVAARARDARIHELLNDPDPTGKKIEELAKLIGQTDRPKL